MKLKTTKKNFKKDETLQASGMALQHLLRYKNPFAYSAGVYGWSCDYYDLDGLYVSMGYRPVGFKVNYALLKHYDDAARDVLDNHDLKYQEKEKQLNTLIDELLKAVKH